MNERKRSCRRNVGTEQPPFEESTIAKHAQGYVTSTKFGSVNRSIVVVLRRGHSASSNRNYSLLSRRRLKL